jgi:hypothetical protein
LNIKSTQVTQGLTRKDHDLDERELGDELDARGEHVVAPGLDLVHEVVDLEAQRHADGDVRDQLVLPGALVRLALPLEGEDPHRTDRPVPVALGHVRQLEQLLGVGRAHGLRAPLGLLPRRVAPALLRDPHDRHRAEALLVLLAVPARRDFREFRE